jgi:hypothetical protein
MANENSDPRTQAELLDEIDQLERENADLQDALDSIADIISSPTDEDEVQDDDDYSDS